MNLTLKVWRQSGPDAEGHIETYDAKDIPTSASFLEMLDIVNEGIITSGGDPIHFDHDCREGICGMCSLTINGIPHGDEKAITTCQLHMRHYKDGETIWIEPFRANAFPVVRDLVVDRSAFDRIVSAGGYIDVRTGSAPDANSVPYSQNGRRRSLCGRSLHRLWRVCRSLQKCLRNVVRLRQGLPPQQVASRQA